MTQPTINWPAFWSGFSEGIVLLSTIAFAIVWGAILPTVGLLYFAGALA